MKTSATTITMLEKALNCNIVPAKSKKSDKQVVIRFGTSVSMKVGKKK